MGEIDFEAEARAWLDLDDAENEEWIERSVTLAAKLREADVRARAEGEAEGYRRGVEAVVMELDLHGMDKALEIARALLPTEPAKPVGLSPVGLTEEQARQLEADAARAIAPEPAKCPHCQSAGTTSAYCPIHGARR